MWACAACLFLSSLFKTRAMSGAVLGGVAIVMFLFLVVFGLPRVLFLLLTRGAFAGGTVFGFGVGAAILVGAGHRDDGWSGDHGESGVARREPALAAD